MNASASNVFNLIPDSNQYQPVTIHKEDIPNLRFINQVANKFLAVSLGNTLFMCDQHAVHERIRLEKLQAVVATNPPTKSTPTNMVIQLDTHKLKILESYKVQFRRFGWSYVSDTHHTKNTICLKSLGVLFDRVLSAKDFQSYLDELVQLIGVHGHPQNLPLPTAVQNILASHACRGAIMFGDVLSREQCEGLLRDLAETKHPFVCAHGRPSIAPVFVVPPPHTTSNHKISFDRLQQRMQRH